MGVGDVSGQASAVAALSGIGITTSLTVAPANLSFGSQSVGSASQSQTVTVSNTGSNSVQIGAVTGTGDFAEIDTCSSHPLTAGASCVVSVSMTPSTTGSRTGTLAIQNSSNGEQLVVLSGVGQEPGLSLSPTSLSFGSLPIGSSTGTALDVVITNTGSSSAHFAGFSATGDFSVTSSCGTLVAGATCSATVTFVPTAVGHRTGALAISSDARGGPLSVSLQGDGAPAGLLLTPPQLNFGVQVIAVPSNPQIATLTNNTGKTITDLSILASGEFSETDNCDDALANGTSCTLHIAVTPATTGAITGSITIGGNQISSMAARSTSLRAHNTLNDSSGRIGTVALQASAIPAGIGLSIPELSFSVTAVGQPSSGQTITVKNTGTQLALTHLTISGNNILEFPFATTCPATLDPQATCTVTVHFLPAGSGLRTGTLNIVADGGISAALPESGTGGALLIPAISIAANAASTLLGSPVTLSVNVSSTSGNPTGAVTFMDGGTPVASVELSSGSAALATSSLSAGVHTFTASYGGDATFAPLESNSLAHAVVDFSLTAIATGKGATGSSETVAPGGTAPYSVTITPTPVDALPAIAVVTVTGLPTGATVDVTTDGWARSSATSWQLPAGIALSPVALVVHIPQAWASSNQGSPPAREAPLLLWGILLLPLAGSFRSSTRRWGKTSMLLWSMLLGAGLVATVTGCGAHNGFYGRAPSTSTITITVTAGSLSHSTQVSVTVE